VGFRHKPSGCCGDITETDITSLQFETSQPQIHLTYYLITLLTHRRHLPAYLNISMSSMAMTQKSSIAKAATLSSAAFASRQATPSPCRLAARASWQPCRNSSSQTSPVAANETATTHKNTAGQQATKAQLPEEIRKKTMAQLDEELRLKLEGISGDGGASGVEYENGQANGLKRNVKANMFRVI
jgi:hypothetical protein